MIKDNCVKEGLYKKGTKKYPLAFVIGQNVFLLVYFGIGFLSMLSLQVYGFPILSVFYVFSLAIMLLFVLRKHLCTHCYYYGKRCNTGWGKLSSFMFKKESGNYQLGIKLANITWALAILIPIIGSILALVLNYSLFTLSLLFLFVSLTPINLVIHKKACEKCKIRFICPVSMAKK